MLKSLHLLTILFFSAGNDSKILNALSLYFSSPFSSPYTKRTGTTELIKTFLTDEFPNRFILFLLSSLNL
jgi:hypothetical protein